MFIGRKNELEALNRLYQSDKFEFVVIYGRRRVGKTALINHFIDDKKAVYFMGIESNERQNLENLSKCLIEFSSGILAETTFSSYQTAIEYAFKLAENERVILAIDEYPYVARASKGLASILQMVIDRYKDNSKLMLILCGSSMSYMEDHVLAYRSPLYGRRTAQMKIMPFDFAECCTYLKRMPDEDKAYMYGVVGGTPQYLLQMDDSMSVEGNIKNTYLNPVSFLYEEPLNLLKQEVREPAVYNAIITAIAAGYTKMSEIATKVGESTAACTGYLRNLINLGVIRKETPYGEKESRKSVYAIEDNMFRFWYRFIPDNSSVIVRGAGNLVYGKIEARLDDYMGRVFEDICGQYLWKRLLEGKMPVEFTSLGRWWGNDPRKRAQTEIDIMGECGPDSAVFAECKWRNENVKQEVLETLVDRSQLFHYTKVHYFLFSKTGFTKACREKAEEMKNVTLVSYDEMMAFFMG